MKARTSAAAPPAPGEVLVMGAGAIGCYLGGRLHAAGVPVTWVGRPHALSHLQRLGLTLSDLHGARQQIPASALRLHDGIPAQAAPALVLLCVKSAATASAAAQLQAHLPAGTPVLSMQNGLVNAPTAQAAAPKLQVVPGMVPYNVAELAPGHFHRGTDGILAAQEHPTLRAWLPWFQRAGLPLRLHADLRAVQWGKLLLNLNNPVNALSGQPLRAQLLERGYRRVLATLIEEALAVLRHAGQPVARLTPLPPAGLPGLLRLPTPLFQVLAARMLRIDEQARSSMADDLARGRPTEIDALCGEVVRLAAAHGCRAPWNAAMVALMHSLPPAPHPMTAAAIMQALEGARRP